jgi:hypothetical protein
MSNLEIDRKDLSYDGMTIRRAQALLNNISNINEDLKYEGYKVGLKYKVKDYKSVIARHQVNGCIDRLKM